jgi:DNA-binding YbaB/EbfC family protein
VCTSGSWYLCKFAPDSRRFSISCEDEKENVINQLGMLAELFRNAGKLRETAEKAFESLGQLAVEGTAGGGAVNVKVNGRLEIVSLRIDPKLLSDGDAELIEDLVVAAVNAGLAKAREAAAQSLGSLATSGLPPGFLANLGGSGTSPGGGGP